ncbi:hypothetical protein CN151_23475 [Sinorhizobium meliloti]|uniref:hypothetical protein n=1 Tax=Rhizobium meliloti TaxID=382 RepID=UPI0002A56C55|nr:hypothetical protein [Sinorhizobium meliloti]AGA07327.1 hypothetical protein C770_GR4Chr2407 [Sinorhizobium meliloti GR4]RVK29499.1 hypothetical protein CN163_28535 [Sinorhizobium meliloti]RVK98882.1 hypothetical protein CN151_23475 [Sinorhizobium meliloti]RVM86326.1 hypothetical protein CN119_29920 [Sinorhizobium meliloti]RVN04331.1 hypothetical protein CN112_25660 [Sinorhizobium meliloti]
MPAAKDQNTSPLGEHLDDVAAALGWHGGDAEATIRTLLADCKHLREQLALAEIALSVGFTRGWRPTCDRSTEAGAP